MNFTIDCQARPQQTPKAMRRSGMIPVVVYGHNGSESLSLAAESKSIKTLLLSATVNNAQVTVNVKEDGQSYKTLLKEVDTNPLSREVYQVAFFSIEGQKKLTVTVPLTFVGEAKGTTEDNGVLDMVLNSLEVDCRPKAIPEEIVVDVTELKVGDILHVSELVLPKGVVQTGVPERVVASVSLRPSDPVQAEEDAAAEAEAGEAAAE